MPVYERLIFEPVGVADDGRGEGARERREWIATIDELDDLTHAMEQAFALGDDGVSRAFLERAGVTVSAAQLDHSLAQLAADPPDLVPERWSEWLSWLSVAAGLGGARSRV